MKVLLLLSGYAFKTTSWEKGSSQVSDKDLMLDFYQGTKYIKKLLKKNDLKVICTLWDGIGIEKVKEIYNPEICISLDQNSFQKKLNTVLGDFEKQRMINRDEWFKKRNKENNLVIPISRTASQLYARQNVIRNALDFLQNSNYEPDIIFLTRFDIGSRGGVFVRNPSFINKAIYSFLKSDKNAPKIFLPLHNQLNMGFPDMWFYMNLKALENMKYIYDEYVSCIMSQNSTYKDLLSNGWPDSEFYPFQDLYDKRQFSNITYSGKRTKNLMKYEQWEASNIHIFYKYYLLLSQKKFQIKFIDRKTSIFSMLLFSDLKNSLPSAFFQMIIGIKIALIIFKKDLVSIIKNIYLRFNIM